MKVEVRREDQIVIFDGECNLCSCSVQFILRNDRQHVFKFATAQSVAGRGLLIDCGLTPEKIETFILLKEGRAYIKSDAALEVAKELDWPWRALKLLCLIPRVLRDPLYDVVARNRYLWFGKKEQCLIPTDGLRSRFIE